MWGIKCCNCEEYRNEWCEKVYYSPFPHIVRDCQYFRRKGMPDFDTEQEAVEAWNRREGAEQEIANHGRLIDADALKERFQSLAYDDWNQGVSTSWADAYRECADMVDEQPTIEPERRTGRWYDVGSLSCRCSECGCKSQKESLFCPNCGAAMTEEQDD